MMLSQQAARMGTVYTTLRKIGMSSSIRQGSANRQVQRLFGTSSSSVRGGAPLSPFSSMAQAYEYEEDEAVVSAVVDRSAGHKASVEARLQHSHEEPWMVNLGREDDTWLHGPRANAWFTGVAPKNCPGVDDSGTALRSLPLPNLAAVTRQAAKEYFDNSWTLYETLFAGLKGEEGFYR